MKDVEGSSVDKWLTRLVVVLEDEEVPSRREWSEDSYDRGS